MRKYNGAFTGGILDEALAGRVDSEKYQVSYADAQNCYL